MVREKYLALCRKLWKEAHPQPADSNGGAARLLPDEPAQEEPHDYRCKKCKGLVAPNFQLESSIVVPLMAVAHWVVAWQQAQSESAAYVPDWRRALAEVIRQRVSMASCPNNIIKGIRLGFIRPDDHWLSLFEQAIELAAEEEGFLVPTTRPP